MNNKELSRGRQTLGMAATTPLPPVREKEMAPPPTAKEIKDANAGDILGKRENAFLGFAKKHPVVTVGSTLAAIAGGFAAVEAYQGNIPGIHRSIEESIPTYFDNNAEVQLLKAGVNATPVFPEQLPSLLNNSIKPLQKDSFPEASILFPVKPGTKQAIRVSISWTDNAFNQLTQKPDRLAWGRKLLIPEKGTEIIIPVKEAEVFRQPLYNGNFDGVTLRFKDSDGVVYGLYINTPEDVRHLVPMDSIKDAPTVKGKYASPADTQRGLILPLGTSILKTDSNDANVIFGFGTAATPEHPKGLANKFDFLQTKDPQGNTTVFYLE